MSQPFSSIIESAVEVRNHYNELQARDGQKAWTPMDRMAGFVGDVGQLSKLMMAKFELRRGPDNLDAELAHEVVDCLWSVIVIADELNLDLESEFNKTMGELHERIERQKADQTKLR